VPVAVSTTSIAVTLDELLAEPHAINIHKSVEDIGTYVACGNVSGRLAGGTLVVGLQQLNGSGDAGVAILTEASGQTEVALYMLVVESAPVAASGTTATIEIVGSNGNWTFEPARLEIAAGTTVTWVNKTETSHTVTGSDLAFEDSGPFGGGETYSQVFTNPGTYQYMCGPHPFMLGMIVVT
jgi:plastocyanin